VTDIQALEARLQSAPEDVPTLLALGQAYQAAERFDEAGQVFLTALAVDHENADAMFHLGMLRFLAEGYEDALVMLAEATARKPDQGPWWINLGVVLEILGHPEEALAAYEAAMETAPELEQAPIHVARLSFDLGRFEQALETARSLAPLRHVYPDILLTEGNSLLALQRLDEAAAVLDEAVSRFPKNPDVLARAGGVHLLADRRSVALQLFERALTYAPRHFDAFMGLGQLAAEAGDTATAQRRFVEAAAIQPARYEPHLALATLSFSAADQIGLGQWTESGLKRNPVNSDLLYFRAVFLRRSGQFAEAEEHLLTALAANPFHQAGHFELADLYRFDLPDETRADGHLRKVVELGAQSPLGRIAAAMLR
jgi:tetratricopeptide (TPR) repeat protein